MNPLLISVGQGLIAILVTVVGFVLNRRTKQIHILVNSRLDESLLRVKALEEKLGLSSGEKIPDPAVMSQVSRTEVK